MGGGRTPIRNLALPALGASTVGLLGSPSGQGPLLAASALIPGKTGSLTLSNPNLFLVSEKPAVLFGTVTKPGAPEEFAYVIVFRHGLAASTSNPLGLLDQVQSMNLSTLGRWSKGVSGGDLTLGGKRIEVVYEVELNETSTAVTREVLTVGGKSKDLAAGHVFLADLAGDSPTYRQKNINLTVAISPLQSTADVERLAEAILSTLENQDSEIKAFLR
jgi:hypothetical protein